MEQIRDRNDMYYAEKSKKRTYEVRNFGCQMNEHDAEKLRGMLHEMGYVPNQDDVADLIVFNTCCVRENAEEKVYGHIGALKSVKREKEDMIIAVCGCMTEQEHVVEEIRKKYENVDLVFGTHNLHRFPELLHQCIFNNTRVYEISKTEGEVVEGVPVLRDSDFKAWVTIMYGCNNFCSYCIVPYVRGRERSRAVNDILQEVVELDKAGVKEITLLGKNVNSYGHDRSDGVDFANLLKLICDSTNIPRIRFMTSHPKDLSDELIEVMANNERICRHLHLPVQSGSTRILEKMNRKYTKEKYLELVKKVKERIPGIALSTDIIVGFPGETEEDFNETLSVVEEVRFDSAFTFIYSKRTGTPAARFEDQIPEEVAKERFNRLLELQNRISREINESYVGRRVEVLVEGLSRTNDKKYTGRTEGNKVVNFDRMDENIDLSGRIVTVRIDSAQTWSLNGTLVNSKN
ncbi:MAG TPA: tRNA (N6-isopentenyl adenosine(37)-C2)-methylthiotransferase MiaB [Clostridia bacterium]|nr:tRNA (N6-isopentenyl adenosine(37)-C2)-methylthiotransferase MiaB [Clostridia bacterium]